MSEKDRSLSLDTAFHEAEILRATVTFSPQDSAFTTAVVEIAIAIFLMSRQMWELLNKPRWLTL